jgi:methyltransferase
MTQPPRAQRMERVIRTYIQACNDADAEAIAACFHPQAAHYFPPGRTSWLGAVTIGGNFANVVRDHGFCWTVDQLLSDVDRYASTMEWTRVNRQGDQLVRGFDWFVFERQTFSIREIRCYYAASLHADLPRQELIDFDYAVRGYLMA